MARLNRYARTAETASVVGAMQSASQRTRHEQRDDEPHEHGQRFVRRWQAAETTRINAAHWSGARGNSINQDLVADLATLHARCAWERSRNPILDGVINTYVDDVVGTQVTLQVQSDDDRYSTRLEEAWKEYWMSPDYAGQLCGQELLRLAVNQLWDAGDILGRRRALREPTTLVGHRVQLLDARRLRTRPTEASDPLVVTGVRRNADGVPVRYTLYDDRSGQYADLSADEVMHSFKVLEPGQYRGVPWSAVSLETLAQIRDFDFETLNAARAAAKFGVVLKNLHPDARYREINDSTPIEDFVLTTAPPGYDPVTIQSHHPGPEYVPFRHERLREVGRPVSMPLMKVLLGSEKHNLAAARMDAKNYERALEVTQRVQLEPHFLNPQLDDVARELSLVQRRGQFVLPRRPRSVTYVWTWQKQPVTDVAKEARAEAARLLETRTLTFAEACAAHGSDEDRVLDSWERTLRNVERRGLQQYFTFKTAAERQTETADAEEDVAV